jgi:DNA invertase Pin-like site-specific DNA recombinase
MPQKRQIMAYYARESDETLAGSVTIDSQIKACVEYGKRQGYILEPENQFVEAISAYEVSYMERKQLLRMLDAAKRKQFDVLVVSEIRALARRQVEVLVIYDILQKYGVKLETINEKFGEDAMSKAVLSLRAMWVEVEREQSYLRMQRGKVDRVLIGQAPNGAIPLYTHIRVDTQREVNGRYALNESVAYTDESGREWTRVDVAKFICNLLLHGGSLNKTAQTLNDMGIPASKGGHWTPETVRRLVGNPIIYGEVYANRYKQVEKRRSRNDKKVKVDMLRPREEWVRLPDAPAIITKEEYDSIQQQISNNKAVSLRNNQQEHPSFVRCHVFCGICGTAMHIRDKASSQQSHIQVLFCRKKAGGDLGLRLNHRTQISVRRVEEGVKEKLVETLLHPETVRQSIEALRNELKPVFDTSDIEATIAQLNMSIRNLYKLAEQATSDDTIADIAMRMNNYEKQKWAAERIIADVADDQEERLEIEAAIAKFEAWVEEVRPSLTNPAYLDKASYTELSMALQVLGIRVTVFPTQGDFVDRFLVDVAVPEIRKKVLSFSSHS